MTPADPGTPEWRDQVRAKISDAYYDARNAGRTMEDAADVAADAVVSDALAALQAREQQVIDRAVELLRGDGPREYLGPPAPLWTEDMRRYYLTGMYEAADFLEHELRPEGDK